MTRSRSTRRNRREQAREAIRSWFARNQLGPLHNYVPR